MRQDEVFPGARIKLLAGAQPIGTIKRRFLRRPGAATYEDNFARRMLIVTWDDDPGREAFVEIDEIERYPTGLDVILNLIRE